MVGGGSVSDLILAAKKWGTNAEMIADVFALHVGKLKVKK